MVLPNDVDLLNPPPELEKKKHKLKRLVQSPNSFFMAWFWDSRDKMCCKSQSFLCSIA
ncbi:Small ribosomal subunit protein eS27w [Ranunculus cassubicifolius]